MIEVNKPTTKTEASAPGDAVAAESTLSLPLFELQPGAGHETADRYQLAELLRYHDRAFVAHTYAALCRRAPSAAEFARTLEDLRTGRHSKSEIIERLCAGQTAVQVAGLPSPALRRVRRWPLLGYMLRLLRGLTRLPVLMQHQQQFENYALAQQQRIADYLNEVLAPAITLQAGIAPGGDVGLAATINDAAESVLMLSDSLIELSARHAAVQTQLEEFQAQQRGVQAQLEESQAQQRGVQAQQEEFQAQQRAVQAQLHADLSTLTATLRTQQQALAEARRMQAEANTAQREFLVQEQRVIVETQRVTLAELQAQLRELAAQVCQLQTRVAATAGAHAPAPAEEGALAPERGPA